MTSRLFSAAHADSRISLLATAPIPANAQFLIIRLASEAAPVDITDAVTVTGSTFSIDVDQALSLLQGSPAFAGLDSLLASRLALRIVAGDSLALSAPLAQNAGDRIDVSPLTELLAQELADQAVADDETDNFFLQLTPDEVAAVRETFLTAVIAAVEDQSLEIDLADLNQSRNALSDAGVTDRVNQAIVVAAVETPEPAVLSELAGQYNQMRFGISLTFLGDGGGVEHYATLTNYALSQNSDEGLTFRITNSEQQSIGQEFFNGDAAVNFVRYEVFELSGDDVFGGPALAGADGTLTLTRDPITLQVERDGTIFDETFDAVTERAGFNPNGLLFSATRESSRQNCAAAPDANCGTPGALLASFDTVTLALSAPVLDQPFVSTSADGHYGAVLLQSSVFNTGRRVTAAVDLNFEASNGLAENFSATRVAFERDTQPLNLSREFERVENEAQPIRFGTPQFDANSPLGNGAFELDLFDGDTLLRGFVVDDTASAFVAVTAPACVDAAGERVQCSADENDRLPEGVNFANLRSDDLDFEYEHSVALGVKLPEALASLEGRYRLRGLGQDFDGATGQANVIRHLLSAANGGVIEFNGDTVTLGRQRLEDVLRAQDVDPANRRIEAIDPPSGGALTLDANVPGRFSFELPAEDDPGESDLIDGQGYVSADGELVVIAISLRPGDVAFDGPFVTSRFGGTFVLMGSRID